MENEFDFFNNLNFGTDFTKQGLAGYGTYTDQYNTPVIENEAPVLIESPTGIETIPAPITPFINQGGDNDGGNGGITTNNLYNKKINDSYLGNPDYQGDLETAKNDTNIKDLINMGLGKQAVDYVKNNYGYMIMNLIFPGSGYVAKAFVDNKKKKEETERLEALAQIEQARKQKEAQAIIAAAEEQATREAATAARARAANPNVYASADAQGFTDGQGGGFGSKSTGTNENFSNNSGRGRTGYFFGGRVNYKIGGRVNFKYGGLASIL